MVGKTMRATGNRLDRLPLSGPILRIIVLISLGFGFEIYDLFLTAYIAPTLGKAGYFAPESLGTLAGLSAIGIHGIGTFVFSLFAGLFVGAIALGSIPDRVGRRAAFTFSMVSYSLCTGLMACQSTGLWIDVWRFLAGVGLGVELVTIDTYLSEWVAPRLRGRAFALCQVIGFSFVPVVAFLAWWLNTRSPFDIEGWRIVVGIGSTGALAAWVLRRSLPESPRWLDSVGRHEEADVAITRIEASFGALSADPANQQAEEVGGTVRRTPHLSAREHRTRLTTLSVFNFFQTFGYYGFSAWVPTLLIARGIGVTTSLEYAFIIALANPLGPAIGYWIGDAFDRKWQIVGAATAIALFGGAFSVTSHPALLVFFGALTTIANNAMSVAYHGYQAEIFPTAVRGRSVGFVYAWSRLSAALSGPIIAALLAAGGVPMVFIFIACSMAIVVVTIGVFGPATRGITLEELAY
jgi:putative MFS transporter